MTTLISNMYFTYLVARKQGGHVLVQKHFMGKIILDKNLAINWIRCDLDFVMVHSLPSFEYQLFLALTGFSSLILLNMKRSIFVLYPS